MLARSLHTTRSCARDERGFTLVEMLVAIATGIVVTLALFAILDLSLRQSGRLNDVAQATQLGRVTMTKIVDELHSACLSPGFLPVQEKSTATNLWFVNAYSNEAVIPNAKEAKVAGTGAYKHDIVWAKEGSKETGTLTDYSYASTGGELPNFAWSPSASPAGGTRIGEKISKTGNTPIFRYYEYSLVNNGTSETPEGSLTLMPEKEFTKAEAEKAASVIISFKTAPADKGSTATDTSLDLTSQVTFAFTVPQSEAKAASTPCQ